MGSTRRRPVALVARASALLLAVGLARAALAAGDLGPPQSAALQCLSPSVAEQAKTVYPPRMLEIKRGAYVRVKLTFDDARSAPSVTFLTDTSEPFEEAISDYARQLRVPCLQPGAAPVTLTQIFDFVPNDGRKVALTLPLDEAQQKGAQSPCVVDANGRDVPKPRYPGDLIRRRKEGNVVVRLRFFDTSLPPEITVLDDGGDRLFEHAVRPSVEALRMSCPGGKMVPFEIQVKYSFFLDGEANRLVLKELALPQFLRAVKPFASGGIYFDTTLMKCPFDVRLTFRQPWNRNQIDELEEDVESRHAFLSWLSTLELDVPSRQANLVLGQTMTIQVPCTRIDL